MSKILSTQRFPFLIDGGLSNVLESQGCNLEHKLWSASVLEANPDKILKAHLAYLEAGAKCIITSSYQASFKGFFELGYSTEQSNGLLLKSVALAQKAVDIFMLDKEKDFRPLVAASIGPYGAYLADGSEYTGDYGVSKEQLQQFHLPRIELLDNTTADCFACETIPSFEEAIVLSDLLKRSQKPAWVSFSCKDGTHISDGTDIRKCGLLFKAHPNVFAVGINCTKPKYISELIRALKESVGDKKIIVYPNSGEMYESATKTWLGTSSLDAFVRMAKSWINEGADIIGGCCRIGPKHIKKLDEVLLNRTK